VNALSETGHRTGNRDPESNILVEEASWVPWQIGGGFLFVKVLIFVVCKRICMFGWVCPRAFCVGGWYRAVAP
jgi:hypothetical protein